MVIMGVIPEGTIKYYRINYNLDFYVPTYKTIGRVLSRASLKTIKTKKAFKIPQ
jgi:hypothetical protein